MQTAFNSGIEKVTGLARTWLVTTTGMQNVSAMRFSAAACWPAGRARRFQETASGRSISAKSKVCISACIAVEQRISGGSKLEPASLS